jgi:hypothetical protein
MLITGFSTFLLPLWKLQSKLISDGYIFISERHDVDISEAFKPKQVRTKFRRTFVRVVLNIENNYSPFAETRQLTETNQAPCRHSWQQGMGKARSYFSVLTAFGRTLTLHSDFGHPCNGTPITWSLHDFILRAKEISRAFVYDDSLLSANGL